MENGGKIASRPISLADIPRCIRTLYSRWICPSNAGMFHAHELQYYWILLVHHTIGTPSIDYPMLAVYLVVSIRGLLCYRGPVVNSLEDLSKWKIMEAFQTLAFPAKPRYTCPSVDKSFSWSPSGALKNSWSSDCCPETVGCETSGSGDVRIMWAGDHRSMENHHF